MKLTAYQFGLSIETTEDQTVIKGDHAYNGVLVQESYTKHESVDEAVCYHVLAIQTLLHWEQPIASTKEEPAPQEIILPQPMEVTKEELALRERRARLLERIQEAATDRYYGGCVALSENLQDLKDELAAVESALGWPESKEPEEANWVIDCPINSPDHPSKAFCPTCLCLLNHEDPSQSCQCGG
jgi:hypothetical protein